MADLTLGIVGKGEMSRENVRAQLGDYVEANPVERIILAVEDASWNDAYEGVLDVIEDNKIPYDAVYDQAAAKDKVLSEVIAAADSKTQVISVARKVVDDLSKAPQPVKLFVLWDTVVEDPELPEEELIDDPGYAALERADERGIKAYDLTNSMDPLTLIGSGDAGDGPPLALEGRDAAISDESAADDEAQQYPSRAELQDMDRDRLKKLAEDAGLYEAGILKARSHAPTIIDALVEHYSKAVNVGDTPPARTPAPAAAERSDEPGDLEVMLKGMQEDLIAEIQLSGKEIITEGQRSSLGLSRIAHDNQTALVAALSSLEESISTLSTRLQAVAAQVEQLQTDVADANKRAKSPAPDQPAMERDDRVERPRRSRSSEERPSRPRRVRRGE